MADNVTITQGTGTTVAADEIAGIKHQRVKVQFGADGSATDASAADPLPVTLPAGINTLGAIRDAGPSWTSVYGVSGARFTSADASLADAAVTDAPTAGQKIVVTDLLISVAIDMQLDFKLETAGTVLATFYIQANSSLFFTFRSKFKLATADKRLMVRAAEDGAVAVTAFYYSEI
jgi:hypothetical protein